MICIVAALEFGHIFADEFALRVELLRLRDRIEDAKIRLRIAAVDAAHCQPPLFAARSKSFSLSAKYCFAPAPVDVQIFDQKDAVTMRSRLCM